MIWGWLIAIAASTASLMLWLGRVPSAARALVGAALMLGLAGYALQGQPDLAGSPMHAADEGDDEGFGEPLRVANSEMSDRFGPAAQWMAMADRMAQRGKTELAVRTLQAGLKTNPDNVDLWVALGNTLAVHGGGTMNPAAALAFDEASARAPDHPAPPFFAGLALAEGGDLAGAEAVWAELLARSPADAPWRTDLIQRLANVRAARAPASPAQQ